jgi:hypothetical protein
VTQLTFSRTSRTPPALLSVEKRVAAAIGRLLHVPRRTIPLLLSIFIFFDITSYIISTLRKLFTHCLPSVVTRLPLVVAACNLAAHLQYFTPFSSVTTLRRTLHPRLTPLSPVIFCLESCGNCHWQIAACIRTATRPSFTTSASIAIHQPVFFQKHASRTSCFA